MLCREGNVSAISFLLGLAIEIAGISQAGRYLASLISESFFSSIYSLFILYLVLLIAVLSIAFRAKDFQIAIRAGILGFLFGVSLTVCLVFEEKYKSFGIYGAFLTLFHFSEYLAIAISNPASLSLESFILTHSIQYGIAALMSWTEFFTEVYFYPETKKVKTLWIIGACLCLSGEILRKLAMLTARKSFHHIVQFEQSDEHKLVTSGVYKYMRHPSYVGWFYWSLGTQIILANPLCFVFYAIASFLFFRERIYMEEITLLNFFGDEYVKYQQVVKTGLPFIAGFEVKVN
ncbi:unnamed protein product [Diamesa serratosioi]